MASSQHETAASGFERKATRTNRSCAVQFMRSCLIYAQPAANQRVMKNPSSQGIVAGIANAPSTLACDARLSDITRIATSSPAAAPPDAETPKRCGDHSLFRASRQVGQRATGCIQHEPHNRQIEEYDSHPWHGLGGDHAAQRKDAAHRETDAESNSHRGTAMHLVRRR